MLPVVLETMANNADSASRPPLLLLSSLFTRSRRIISWPLANNSFFPQYKQSGHQSRTTSTTSSGLGKSIGPSRYAPTDRPVTRLGRPTHGRSKSQAPRPRTAHGSRNDEPTDDTDDNGTAQPLCDAHYTFFPGCPPVPKLRSHPDSQPSVNARDFSLSAKFSALNLHEANPDVAGTASRSRSPSVTSPSPHHPGTAINSSSDVQTDQIRLAQTCDGKPDNFGAT